MMKKADRWMLIVLVSAAILFAGCSDRNVTGAPDRSTADEAATENDVLLELDGDSLAGTWVGDFETWRFDPYGSGEITENNGDDHASFDYEIIDDETVIFHVGSPDDSQKATCRLTRHTLILDFEDGKHFDLTAKE